MNRVRSGAALRLSRNRKSLWAKAFWNAASVAPTAADAGNSTCILNITSAPGCTSAVPANALAATKHFAPNNWLSPMLSGAPVILPRNTMGTPPSVTLSPGRSPSVCAASGASSNPGLPSAACASSANWPAGRLATDPSNGHPGPTALTAANSRPERDTSIDLVSTVSEIRAPRLLNQCIIADDIGPSPDEISISPPRIPRLLSAIPCPSAARSEKIPATEATPTPRHSKTISKPPRPPRKSRRARRQASLIMPRSRRRAAPPCGRTVPPVPDHG